MNKTIGTVGSEYVQIHAISTHFTDKRPRERISTHL